MKVDLNILLKNLQAGKMLEDFENNMIEGFPYMEVNYENNLSSPEKQLQLTVQKMIFLFLKILTLFLKILFAKFFQ